MTKKKSIGDYVALIIAWVVFIAVLIGLVLLSEMFFTNLFSSHGSKPIVTSQKTEYENPNVAIEQAVLKINADSKTFSNSEFSITYPDTYKEVVSTIPGSLLFVHSSDGAFSIVETATDHLDQEQLNLMSEAVAVAKGYIVEDYVLSGVNTKLTTYIQTINNVQLKTSSVVLDVNGKMIDLVFSTRSDLYSNKLPELNSILKSFKLK